MSPSALDRPSAPSGVGVASPVLPALKIEGTKPAAVERWLRGAVDLDAAKKFRQLVFGLDHVFVARCGCRLVQSEKGKIRGVEQIG